MLRLKVFVFTSSNWDEFTSPMIARSRMDILPIITTKLNIYDYDKYD
jgi:hypothetical protein